MKVIVQTRAAPITSRLDISWVISKVSVALKSSNPMYYIHYCFFLIPHVIYKPFSNLQFLSNGGRRARDRMVVGLTTTCLISTYHH